MKVTRTQRGPISCKGESGGVGCVKEVIGKGQNTGMCGMPISVTLCGLQLDILFQYLVQALRGPLGVVVMGYDYEL